jgi:hypothetical protein
MGLNVAGRDKTSHYSILIALQGITLPYLLRFNDSS